MLQSIINDIIFRDLFTKEQKRHIVLWYVFVAVVSLFLGTILIIVKFFELTLKIFGIITSK